MAMWIFREPDTRFFMAEQLAQVAALFEGILPAGADHPGASDVDAAEYLNRLLAMDASTYYEIPAWQKLYAEALPALEAASVSQRDARAVGAIVAGDTNRNAGRNGFQEALRNPAVALH
jgi:hypothetical protein